MSAKPYQLELVSVSRSSDASHLASADLATIGDMMGADYRLVGGNAVTLLTAVHGVMSLVPERETADADFGAAPEVIGNEELVVRLRELGYVQVEGNRFARTLFHADAPLDLVIDVLAPSYVGRLVADRPYGELTVDEVPGLHLALARPPTAIIANVRLTNGAVLTYSVPLPEVTAALVMKAYGYRARLLDRDAVDIWRLLEAANADGVSTATWPTGGSARDAAETLNRYFRDPGAIGLRQATRDSRHATRIRALVAQVVPRS